MTPVTSPADPRLSRCTSYLKGEPKALGVVQIMIGIITFLCGIVLPFSFITLGVISGITLWGSLIFISSGALSVASVNHQNPCVVQASLGMNVISAVVAGLDIILFSVDMVLGVYIIDRCYNYNSHSGHSYYDSGYSCVHRIWSMYYGIYGVLLVFALLEFIISICTSAFACKASCFNPSTTVTGQVMYTQPMNLQPMNNPGFNPGFNPAYNQVPQQQPPVISYNV